MPLFLPLIAAALLWGGSLSAAEDASPTADVSAADAAAADAAEPCADIPAFCRWEVRRIEEACAAGLKAAARPEEEAEALRRRNADLRQVMERTYVAVLSWLLGRSDLARVLEEDQARYNQMLDGLPDGDARELNLIADKLRQRLRLFGTVTAAAFTPERLEEE